MKILLITFFIIILLVLWYFWRTRKPFNYYYDRRKLTEALLDNSISCIYVKDQNLRYLLVNRHALEVFGFEEDEVIGKTDEELFPAPYAITSRASDLKVLKEGLTVKEELVANLRRGDRDFYTIKTPLKTVHGKIYALCGIAMDISKQKAAQRQLNSYLEKLEDVTTELMEARISQDEVNRLQNAFLASVSHELRTPLNGIIGNSSLLLNTEMTETQKKYLNRIKSSGVILMGVIGQILDYSKIAAGKVKLELKKCDLIDILKECYEILMVKAEEKGIELTIKVPEKQIPSVLVDPIRLKEVILNLLGNAVKFTDKGSVQLNCVCLSFLPSKILVQIDIVDTGIGLTKEQMGHLFEKFWQGRPVQTGGTGLGLVITKELVEMMSGNITVESKPNEGSCFTLKIPFEIPQGES